MKKPLTFFRFPPALSPVLRRGYTAIAVITLLLLPLVNNAQTIPVFTLNMQNATLEQLMGRIQSQSSYSFLYKDSELDTKTQVSVNVRDKTLAYILEEVFKNKDIDYRINGNQVILSKKKIIISTGPVSSKTVVRGFVTDPAGNPLTGVTVISLDDQTGVITDHDGWYSIEVAGSQSQLQFKFLGYKPAIVTVGNRTVQNVTMQEEVSEFEEVVVVGYGTQRKASMVGSVATINADDLSIPATNLSTGFAGRLAGVIAVQRSGEPGADGADFWIRGISSFNSGAQSPLIVLDGVQVEKGELNGIDPEMIESFSVLKDASASALYGMRGANGVMIVNTKTGRNLDKAIVNVRIENSYSMPMKLPKFTDGVKFMEMFNDAVNTRGGNRSMLYSEEKIYGTRIGADPYVFPNVNWYNEMFRKGSMSQHVNVSVRGGGAKVDYFSSVSVNHDNGMLKNTDLFSYNSNISNMRYVLQNNINANVSRTTRLSLKLNFQIWDNHGPDADNTDNFFNRVMNANPVDFPVMFPQLEEYNYIMWGGKQGGRYNSSFENPYASMATGYRDSFSNSITGTLGLNQRMDFLTKGLSFDGLVSFKNYSHTLKRMIANYNQFQVQNYDWNGDRTVIDSYYVQRIGQEQGTSLTPNNSSSSDYQIYLQAKLDYNRVFGMHDIGAMLLYNQHEKTYSNITYPYRKQGIAGRITYAYDYKYLFEANFGYNGSENFAKGHRFGFFPSIGVGYAISRERFFEPLTPVINDLKIRGSWGTAGNDQVNQERFLYLSQITLNHSDMKWTTGRDQNTSKSGPKYDLYGNQYLSWEVGEKFNVGFDVALWRSLNITFDYFTEKRRDILVQRGTTPAFIGITPKDRWMNLETDVYANLGKVKNKGFDISADYYKSINNNLHISFKGTFTFAKNRILEVDEADFMEYPNLSRVGTKVNQYLLYMADRLFIDEAEIISSPTQVIGGIIKPGDIKYYDIENVYGETDGVIDTNDRIYSGYPSTPEVVYGFGPSVIYKKWDFSLFFQGTARVSILMSGIHPFGTDYTRNVRTFVADDYWSENNQNIYAKYPRLSKDDIPNNTANSTYWLHNGSYLKLKNAEIGFTHKFARIYVRGANLLVFSKFKHWDPEQGSGNGMKYPTQRVVNLGVQLKFN